jgi:hypothetical protein
MPVKEIGGSRIYVENGAFQDAVFSDSNSYGVQTVQGITSVIIPEGVTKIGAEAFAYQDRNGTRPGTLTSITIPNSVTDIGSKAFSNQAITSVTLPKGLSKVGEGIFENCKALKTVTIPEGVTTIGITMFNGCTALAAITIPQSVTSIGKGAFNATGLTSITWPASIAALPGGGYIGGTPVGGIFENCTKLTSVVLPEGVQSIGYYAFNGCTALTSIALPSTIIEIQDGAFRGCTALTTVTIPEAVKAIYFNGVILPPSVTTIGSGAFDDTYLTSITIGADVNIGRNAFYLYFINFYDQNGKKAGVYKYDGDRGTWTYTE